MYLSRSASNRSQMTFAGSAQLPFPIVHTARRFLARLGAAEAQSQKLLRRPRRVTRRTNRSIELGPGMSQPWCMTGQGLNCACQT